MVKVGGGCMGQRWQHQRACRYTLYFSACAPLLLLKSSSSAPLHLPSTCCSTWRKLQSAGKSVKDVSDIAQLRVVLEPATGEALLLLGSATSDRQLCYHVMGLVHSFWAPIPGGCWRAVVDPVVLRAMSASVGLQSCLVSWI